MDAMTQNASDRLFPHEILQETHVSVQLDTPDVCSRCTSGSASGQTAVRYQSTNSCLHGENSLCHRPIHGWSKGFWQEARLYLVGETVVEVLLLCFFFFSFKLWLIPTLVSVTSKSCFPQVAAGNQAAVNLVEVFAEKYEMAAKLNFELIHADDWIQTSGKLAV